MNIEEMTKNLQELVDDPKKAAIIFKVILASGNPDVIQRALELYVLLVLNHAEEIEKALNEEHDNEQSHDEIIRRLERELHDIGKDRDYRDRSNRQREVSKWEKWDKYEYPVSPFPDKNKYTTKD